MKIKTIIVSCLIATTSINAQNHEWTKSFGGTLNDNGNSIIVDFSGNVYTTGFFEGTVDFNPNEGTENLTSAGDFDVFVQKIDASGNFIWAKAFGGNLRDTGSSISVDVSGNVYVIGTFEGTADFDPGVEIANLTSAGNEDIFVMKMDASGNFLWAKAFGGTENDNGNCIIADSSGNIYTTGFFRGVVDFDPGQGTASFTSESGSSDIFVQKMDASGNFLWAKAFGGGFADHGNSIILDNAGNVYTLGYFQGTADFDPGTEVNNLTSAGSEDVFVQKMNDSGNFIWAKSFGGTSDDYGSSITMDSSGNIFCTGHFSGNVDFDPGSGTAILTSNGLTDIFVQKLDTSGNFIWAKSLGSTNVDTARDIIADQSENIYTTGTFFGTVDFDPGPATAELTSVGSYDIFVQKLDTSGNFIWAVAFGGASTDNGKSLSIDGSGRLFTTGSFQDTVDFDPNSGTTYITSIGSHDIFVQNLSQETAGIFEFGNGIQVLTYPNPSKDLVHVLFRQPIKNVNLTLTDVQGKLIYTKHLNAATSTQINIPGPAGIYFLNIKTPNAQSVVKLIKE